MGMFILLVLSVMLLCYVYVWHEIEEQYCPDCDVWYCGSSCPVCGEKTSYF